MSSVEPKVIVRQNGHFMTITINRPKVINSLDLETVQLLNNALNLSETLDEVRVLVLDGAGDRGFCAGGDMKAVYQAVKDHDVDQGMAFFKAEYALDFRLHRFPKPVIVLANGIVMGGGLGLAAAAHICVATETTRMAMPETRIGFFPDVGASGWMFRKCPQGYPEFLSLTGYEIKGLESVRAGLAAHLLEQQKLPDLFNTIEKKAKDLSQNKEEALEQLRLLVRDMASGTVPQNPEMDEWVACFFGGKTSVAQILKDLSEKKSQKKQRKGVFQRLSELSPTSLVFALDLLRFNENRSLKEVFQTDVHAARFIITQPDFAEGVRARLVDKDNLPKWQPDTIEKAEELNKAINEEVFLTI